MQTPAQTRREAAQLAVLLSLIFVVYALAPVLS